jgi:hypothetical protein
MCGCSLSLALREERKVSVKNVVFWDVFQETTFFTVTTMKTSILM